MSAAHLHLLTGHFPFVSSVLAVMLLLVALLRRQDHGLLLAAALVLAVTGGTAIASNLTGTPAEESVADRPGADTSYIPSHEIRGDIATLAAGVTALVALGLLFGPLRRRPAPARAVGLLLVLAFVTAGLLAWTGLAGGKIRHDEIRASALR